MKKIVIIFILLAVVGMYGVVELEYNEENVRITGDFEIEQITEIEIKGIKYNEVKLESCRYGGLPEREAMAHFTEMLMLPPVGNWEINSLNYSWEEIELDHPLISNSHQEFEKENGYRSGWIPGEIVVINEPVIMRELRFSQVSVQGMQYDPSNGKIRVIKDLELELNIDHDNRSNAGQSRLTTESSIFSQSIGGIRGFEDDRYCGQGAYLFICPDIPEIISVLEYLADWKRKLGHEVSIATLSETGSTNTEIKDYLQGAYDNWEEKPEYVVLVGDVSGNIELPSWFIPGFLGPFDVTDHPYTLLDGEDYFPDIMLGRFSPQSLIQLQTIASKIIGYESNPPLGNNWTNRAIMCSYVVDHGGFYQMYSQRETVMAVREKLLDFTYTEVDTFISPWQFGASNLAGMINEGCGLINYRGAGSPTYWVGYSDNIFSVWDFPMLNNGFMLPLVTSIVCGGGDFANDDCVTSFGELWLAAGTPETPVGAIAFIGPSELDTKTPFNNCNDMGIYQGICEEGIFEPGMMMLRGKMELYNNYPDCHEMDGFNDAWDSDKFYFYVYNLLGDPGVRIWTDEPRTITADIPQQVSETAGQLTIEVEDIEVEFTAALTMPGQLLDVSVTDAEGRVTLAIPAEADSFDVTLSAYGYIPFTATVERSSNIEELSLLNWEFNREPQVGQEVELTLNIANNTGSALNSISVEILTEDEKVEITENQQQIDGLESEESVELTFDLNFSDLWREENQSRLEVVFNEGELGRNVILYTVGSPWIEYGEHTVQNTYNRLIQGETNQLILSLYNGGDIDSDEVICLLSSLDDKCQITTGNCNFGNIAPQELEMGCSAYELYIEDDVLTGEPLGFRLFIIKDGGIVSEYDFNLEAGLVSEESPTYSDYGYYALESSDSGNFITPEFDWEEIAPGEGGNGELVPEGHVTSDGYSTCIPLPFQFCYYGRYYSEITVSSNGWIAMGNEEFVFFRNWMIPSGVGPKAMIAPFWDEISDGDIYVWFNDNEHYFVIEWYDFEDITGNWEETFQVILYDQEYHPTTTGEGEIKFQYQEIHNTDQSQNYSTIGIENYEQNKGLLLSYANRSPETVHEIQSGTAILFSIKEGTQLPELELEQTELTISLPPDTTSTVELSLSNTSNISDIPYEIHVSHFPRGERSGFSDRDISGSSITPVNQSYFTSYEMDLYAFMVHETPDYEGIIGVNMNFPAYVNVSGATDIAELYYNGETGGGAEVSWGFGNGENYDESYPQTFHVFLTVDEGTNCPVPIEWEIVGDGNGTGQHTISGGFTLMPSEDTYIWLEYPNGGEQIAYGIMDTIRWSSYGDITQVDVFYTTNYFVNYEIIAENIENSGSLEWQVPSEFTSNARIRIRDANGNLYDDTDESFQILGLVITSPADGDVFSYGSYAEICWDYAGGAETVDLELSTTSGYSWQPLAEGIPNTGSYTFQVNLPPSENCKIKISSSDGLIEQVMAGEFTITDVCVNWIDIEPEEGTIEPGAFEPLSLVIDTSDLTPGHYQAYVTIITEYGQKLNIPVFLEILNLEAEEAELPQVYLSGAYPNPFSSSCNRGNGTHISFNLTKSSRVKLSAYNIKGQLVRVFIDEEMASGNYDINWDGTDRSGKPLATGVYFYQLEIDKTRKVTKKCMLLN